VDNEHGSGLPPDRESGQDFEPSLGRLMAVDRAALARSGMIRLGLGVLVAAVATVAWTAGYFLTREGYPGYPMWVRVAAVSLIPLLLMIHTAAVRDLATRKNPMYAPYSLLVLVQHVLVRMGFLTLLLWVAVGLAWVVQGWGFWPWLLAWETLGAFFLVGWASTAMLLRVVLVAAARAGGVDAVGEARIGAIRVVFLALAAAYGGAHWLRAADRPAEVLLASVVLAGALLLMGLNGVRGGSAQGLRR